MIKVINHTAALIALRDSAKTCYTFIIHPNGCINIYKYVFINMYKNLNEYKFLLYFYM